MSGHYDQCEDCGGNGCDMCSQTGSIHCHLTYCQGALRWTR